MSREKARTTIGEYWTLLQENKSDVTMVLLILNTVLLLLIRMTQATRGSVYHTLQQEKIYEMGGVENYEKHKEIIETPGYREQQTFIINQKHKTFFPEHYKAE